MLANSDVDDESIHPLPLRFVRWSLIVLPRFSAFAGIFEEGLTRNLLRVMVKTRKMISLVAQETDVLHIVRTYTSKLSSAPIFVSRLCIKISLLEYSYTTLLDSHIIKRINIRFLSLRHIPAQLSSWRTCSSCFPSLSVSLFHWEPFPLSW
jgi:hypothetical protein